MNQPKVFPMRALFPLFLAVSGLVAQDPVPSASPNDAGDEVSSIVERLLASSSQDLGNGATASWPALPSSDDYKRVRSYGAAAVPALMPHIRSPLARESELAIRLLGGGVDGVWSTPVLLELVSNAGAPGWRRIFAVRWLRDANNDDVDAALRKIAETDSDEAMRKAAKEALCGSAKGCGNPSGQR